MQCMCPDPPLRSPSSQDWESEFADKFNEGDRLIKGMDPMSTYTNPKLSQPPYLKPTRVHTAAPTLQPKTPSVLVLIPKWPCFFTLPEAWQT